MIKVYTSQMVGFVRTLTDDEFKEFRRVANKLIDSETTSRGV